MDTVEVRKAFTVVGTAVPRVDAVEKTTGAAQYVADISRPGMLHAAVLRSPYARARILGIDVSKAAALEGVQVVMTADDTPKIAWGQYRRDQYPLALGEVHFAGDEVAAVAAVDLRTAREALKLIEVEWQELEPVLSLDEACAR
ncbi:MAG TPA: hypothetical protein VN603_08040, partial [Candidatus Acidoferrales bacterium]|nr:hypothetical protein [Candidatus Acidoferrales bacterium]